VEFLAKAEEKMEGKGALETNAPPFSQDEIILE